MAKVTKNPLLGNLNGAIGDLVFYRNPDTGEQVVQARGARQAALSPAQLAHHELIKLAALYGNSVKTDPVLAQIYWPFCRGRMTPYQAALRDYLRPPIVTAIGLPPIMGKPGQIIRVIATDDTQVLSVRLVIRTAAGQVLEEGPASPSVTRDHWTYTTQVEIPAATGIVVEATAVDRPGHAGKASVSFYVS
jgi:hypothetical protein